MLILFKLTVTVVPYSLGQNLERLTSTKLKRYGMHKEFTNPIGLFEQRRLPIAQI